MKKSFSNFSRVAAIVFTIFFVFSLFSCTGLLASTAENGSVSFVLDKAVFNAARSGTNGGEDFSYRVVVSLEDGKDFGLKQTVNITEKDFSDTKKTNGYFEANFPKVPVGKKVYAIVKIFEQFPHHEERDIDNPDADPVMIGKSDVYKIKSGKNQITLKAYNYRYNFPFSITITFDELSENDISALEQDLLITAVAADSDEAKRVAAAGSDKYKIYEALSNSLTGEDQLAKSYGAKFTFNQTAKKLTVSGNMLLPINPDEAATKGKDVILVAAMYKYDSSTSKFKAKLFGQSEKISPLKAATNEVSFAAKKLNIVDTPVVLFEENMVATGYYTGSKEHSIYNSEGHGLVGLLGPIFCFDSDGNIYTIIESSQDGFYELNTNNISLETCLIPKYSQIFENQYITVDLANNCFYSYYPFENELFLYQYPDYISAGQVDEENDWTFNPGSVEIDGQTISPVPMSCIINDGIVYLIAKDGSSNDAGYFLYEHVLGEEGRHTLTNAKKIDLPYGDITDVIYLDGNLYFLAEYPLTGWRSVISSRGVVVKYDIDDNTFESVGISSDKVENTSMTENVGVHLYLNTSQLFTDSGRNNPVVLKGNTAISTGLLNSEFPTICTPNPLNKTLSTTALYGASKIIAIKPKKLVISEDGIAFYTENDQLFFKNVNRIVTIDLETFALEFEDTDVSFCDDKQDMYSSLMEDTVFNSFFWQTNFETNTTLYPANDGTAFNSSTVPNATFYICISNKED